MSDCEPKWNRIEDKESLSDEKMSAPAAQNQQSATGVPPSTAQAGTPTGPPPVPSSKPVLSSPGAYMANFTGSAAAPTAGIHSVNKTHEKPAIAARPIPPPTLPKYSSSFSKADRDRNEFGASGKIDRAEREKVRNACPNRRHAFTQRFHLDEPFKSGLNHLYLNVLDVFPILFRSDFVPFRICFRLFHDFG